MLEFFVNDALGRIEIIRIIYTIIGKPQFV